MPINILNTFNQTTNSWKMVSFHPWFYLEKNNKISQVMWFCIFFLSFCHIFALKLHQICKLYDFFSIHENKSLRLKSSLDNLCAHRNVNKTMDAGRMVSCTVNIILSLLKMALKWALENKHNSMITIDFNPYISLKISSLWKLSKMLISAYFYRI